MKRDLFFCFTPLQILIATSIVVSDEYEGGHPECYVFAPSDSKKYKHYYELIKPLCSKAEFVTSLPSFPFYLKWLRKRFSGMEYRNIYISSVDSVLVHFVLSWVRFGQVRTFDDGTANIIESSKYYCDELSFESKLKRFIWAIFGNRYSRKRIIEKSKVHFTLYPGFKNLISNVKPISLNVPRSTTKSATKKKVTILLGAVIEDLLQNKNCKRDLINNINKYYLSRLSSDVFHIPHPRAKNSYFTEIPQRESALIAEDLISEYLNEYQEVELVGFGSSTQFNLMGQHRIKNVVLDSNLLRPQIRHGIRRLIESGAELVMLD